MKISYIYKGIATILLAVGMTSCSDFLDKEPSNELTGAQTFGSWVTMEQFHYDTYNFLRNGQCRIGNSWLDAATDLAETSYSNGGTRVSFNIGNYYATAAANELTAPWEHYYRGIRKCNMLLERIDTVPKSADLTQEDYLKKLNYYKGEARTLRVWFYWELFLRYGPVPLVTEVLDPDGDLLSNYTTRPTVKEFVVDFLIPELDASELLVMDKSESDASGNQGRINKPIVSALRSRIMLYMASPRYSAESGITWQQAADAAKQFIDNYGGEYSIYMDGSGPVENYTNAILLNAYNEGNTETIFYRNDGTQGWGSYGYYNDTPVGYGGNGGLCPSQNLVDMYDMADGSSPFKSYDETGAPVFSNGIAPTTADIRNNDYNDSYPTSNRDPRLSATILYHGASWGSSTINVVRGEKDNPIGNANATPTGYYLRKYMPEVILQAEHTGGSSRNWIIIRYAEILLNYAEALNEAGGSRSQVLNAIQPLRDRVNMPSLLAHTGLATQSDIRNFIRRERTVELAMEEHRAWDLRRWNVAEQALGRDIIGVDVATNGKYTRKVAQTRQFDSKMYLYPIPEGESWKTNIANNPGWN